MTYRGLLFSYRNTLKEVELASQYFGKYVAAESQGVLEGWFQQLRVFRQMGQRQATCSWEIRTSRPLRTIISEGAYQPEHQGGLRVIGELSATWTIEHVGRHANVARDDEVFRLIDLGSTLIKVMKIGQDDGETCVAAWHFDIGVAISPGFHFHTQVSTRPDAVDRAAEVYFPLALDVPRLPAVLFFPLDAFEFLLAELFHAEWPRHAASQHARLGFFEYQIGRLKGLIGSWGFTPGAVPPLSTLRSQKPLERSFLL